MVCWETNLCLCSPQRTLPPRNDDQKPLLQIVSAHGQYAALTTPNTSLFRSLTSTHPKSAYTKLLIQSPLSNQVSRLPNRQRLRPGGGHPSTPAMCMQAPPNKLNRTARRCCGSKEKNTVDLSSSLFLLLPCPFSTCCDAKPSRSGNCLSHPLYK